MLQILVLTAQLINKIIFNNYKLLNKFNLTFNFAYLSLLFICDRDHFPNSTTTKEGLLFLFLKIFIRLYC